MDIDIGNLVYIVFVAIIIIVNLFTKGKKKQGGPGTPNAPQETKGPAPIDSRKSFEELLEEFTKPQQPSAPAPAPAPVPAKPKSRPVAQSTYQAKPVTRTQPKPRPKKEHRAMKTENVKFDEFKEKKRKSSHYGDAFRDLDSAKKAFIYSEIFKKKYE